MRLQIRQRLRSAGPILAAPKLRKLVFAIGAQSSIAGYSVCFAPGSVIPFTPVTPRSPVQLDPAIHLHHVPGCVAADIGDLVFAVDVEHHRLVEQDHGARFAVNEMALGKPAHEDTDEAFILWIPRWGTVAMTKTTY